MNCENFLAQLDCWIDRELDPESEEALMQHLRECAECEGEVNERRKLDQMLRVQLAPTIGDIDALHERIKRQLPYQTQVRTVSSQWLTAFGWIGSAVAGFIVASVVLPWSAKSQQPMIGRTTVVPEPTRFAELTSLAGVLSADRAVEVGECVATTDDWPCELTTTSGKTVLRLDAASEMCVESENAVRLTNGRLWCQTNDPGRPFTVRARRVTVTARAAACTIDLADEQCLVNGISGAVDVQSGSEPPQQVHTGQQLVISDTGIIGRESVDPLLVSGWISPILRNKPVGTPELQLRISELWSRIGPARTASERDQYEIELRELGTSCVTPLCEFLCPSDQQVAVSTNEGEATRRERAASLLADLVDRDTVGRLVDLLADENPIVRYHAARGLTRVSGETFGMAPEDWKNLTTHECRIASETWRRWVRNPQLPQPPVRQFLKKA